MTSNRVGRRIERAVGCARGWLAVRHPLRVELALVLGVYAVYEAARGLVVGSSSVAVRHAADVASLERTLHLFAERPVQDAAARVPGLVGTLGVAYLTLHLALTAGLLLWLHRRRPGAYAVVRTTLVVASAFAVVGYLAFPTAPPRLDGLGILDTISGHAGVDLNGGLVGALYNPYAAMPSMHAGYALVVGATLLRQGRRLAVRVVGGAYPAFVVLVIVATGNHFLLDAVAGMAVAALGAGVSVLLVRRPPAAPPTVLRRRAREASAARRAA